MKCLSDYQNLPMTIKEITNSTGSFLSIDFGQDLGLVRILKNWPRIREYEFSFLILYCEWELYHEDKVILHCEFVGNEAKKIFKEILKNEISLIDVCQIENTSNFAVKFSNDYTIILYADPSYYGNNVEIFTFFQINLNKTISYRVSNGWEENIRNKNN